MSDPSFQPFPIAPEKRHYKAYGAALQVWTDRSPEILMSGPAGTGKTKCWLEKLHACALRWPGMRGLIVRKTRESLNESVLQTYEDKVLPANSPICAGMRRASRNVYRYPNGSEIIVGGLRQAGRDATQKVMSTEYDFIYVPEAIELTEEEWEKLSTRLRNGVMPFQQLGGDTNPDKPTHWLKRREKKGQLKFYESRHEDNPTIWDMKKNEPTEQGRLYLARLDALTGVRYLRLRKGLWVQAEGVVYPGFDPAIHVIDPIPIPDSWRRIRSIDFGYSNPFVCGFYAIDHDNRMYRYREIYRTKRTVKVHADQIRKLSVGEAIHYTVADHDAEDRATLRENRIPTVAARKQIRPGIQAVEERLKVRGDGKPGIFFFRDALVEPDPELVEAKKCISILEEFESYSWAPGQDNKNEKEVPMDADNHACLVGETLISTERGMRRIDLIEKGEKVWTRKGLRTVLEAGMTSDNAELWEVRFSDGSSLVGTHDHPVFVIGKGFTWLCDLAIDTPVDTPVISWVVSNLYVTSVQALDVAASVYNLTVDDAHEFYANGILVSNCDELRYAIMSVDRQKPPSEPDDTPPEVIEKAKADAAEEARLKYLWNNPALWY